MTAARPRPFDTPDRPRPKPGVLDIAPYVGGKSKIAGVAEPIKLSSNENILGCSPLAKAAYARAAETLHLYPDGRCQRLREALAARYGLDPLRLVFGCGSDELFSLLAQVYCQPGDNVVQGEFGFLAYRIAGRAAGAEVRFAPEPNLRVDVDAVLACVDERTRVVYIADPANPTGTAIGRAQMQALARALPQRVLLVIDGAYAEFAEADDYEDGFDLARGAGNIVVTRTFSKIHGLAALRVGWGYMPLEVADAVERIRPPFNVGGPAQEAALAALDDEAFVRASQDLVRAWRPWLAQQLGGLGFEVAPSQGNFVLARFPGEGAALAAEAFLASQGVIVRACGNYGLPQHLRITVGLEDQNRRVVEALTAFRRLSATS